MDMYYIKKKQKEPSNEATYLRDDPVFAYGCSGFEYALRPGRYVTCTVISIALEHQLAYALVAGLKCTKGHAVSQAVQHL